MIQWAKELALGRKIALSGEISIWAICLWPSPHHAGWPWGLAASLAWEVGSDWIVKNWLSSSSPACFIWAVPADFSLTSLCGVCVYVRACQALCVCVCARVCVRACMSGPGPGRACEWGPFLYLEAQFLDFSLGCSSKMPSSVRPSLTTLWVILHQVSRFLFPEALFTLWSDVDHLSRTGSSSVLHSALVRTMMVLWVTSPGAQACACTCVALGHHRWRQSWGRATASHRPLLCWHSACCVRGPC